MEYTQKDTFPSFPTSYTGGQVAGPVFHALDQAGVRWEEINVLVPWFCSFSILGLIADLNPKKG